jgi:hypothetical protein
MAKLQKSALPLLSLSLSYRGQQTRRETEIDSQTLVAKIHNDWGVKDL